METRQLIIVNEAKGNVNLYHIRVEVSGVPLWTGVYAENVERANRLAEKMFGKGNVRGRPTKANESIGEAKGKGPHNKVKKGSQKRYKHPMATDKPDKYIGKWEAYDEPQGVGSKAANVTMKPPANESFDMKPGEFKKINPARIAPRQGDKVVYAAQFQVDGMNYVAWGEHDPEYPGLYHFSFDTMDRSDDGAKKFMRTGAGHPRQVFATVFPIIRDFLDSKEIPAVMFSGSDPKQSILYDKIVKKHGDGGIHQSYFIPRHFKYPVQEPVIQHRVWPLRENHEESKAEVPEKVFMDDSVSEGHSLGPAFSRGLTNSSTGRGAAPPQTDFDPKELSNVLRPRKKQPGAKAPTRKVEKTVSKSLTDKVRKPNAKVTEMEIPTRLDELFGRGQTLPHDYDAQGYSEIEVGEDTSVVVGFEDIQGYVPGAKPGLNAGFATMHQGQLMHGLDRESLGLDRRTIFALFNTVISIVERWVNDNRPDRVYFVAVEPMKNIYPRLIKKFVDSDEWKVSKGRKMIPLIGQELDIYMCERRSIEEMVRLPIQTKFNADYEIKDGEKPVGMAKITDGVIEQLMINQEEADEQFKGHALSMTLGAIVRDADLQNANLAMQIADLEDQDMKRYLERFGFRHVGQGIFKRTAGSITPPSVIEDDGKEPWFDFNLS